MTTLLVRSTILRRWTLASRASLAGYPLTLRTLAGLTSANPLEWNDHERRFYEKGWLDDQKLTQFETLHEMQVRSCQVYADRPLFGTYNNAVQKFEWMNFAQYDETVNRCRAFLKDLGT